MRDITSFLRSTPLGRVFLRYASVGVLNTLVHWGVFFLLYQLGASQAVSNAGAFLVAVTLSFVLNAVFTFAAKATGARYLCFVTFMGALGLATGGAADRFALHPLVTLMVFSSLSLVLGFAYSRWFVFRRRI